jgi:hypothetical protein
LLRTNGTESPTSSRANNGTERKVCNSIPECIPLLSREQCLCGNSAKYFLRSLAKRAACYGAAYLAYLPRQESKPTGNSTAKCFRCSLYGANGCGSPKVTATRHHFASKPL